MAGNALTPLLSREEFRQLYLQTLAHEARNQAFNLQANIDWSMTGDTEQEAALAGTLAAMPRMQVDSEAQQYLRALVVPRDFQWVYSRLNLDMKKWIILNYAKMAEVLTKQGQRPAAGALFLSTMASMYQFFNTNSAASVADYNAAILAESKRNAAPPNVINATVPVAPVTQSPEPPTTQRPTSAAPVNTPFGTTNVKEQVIKHEDRTPSTGPSMLASLGNFAHLYPDRSNEVPGSYDDKPRIGDASNETPFSTPPPPPTPAPRTPFSSNQPAPPTDQPLPPRAERPSSPRRQAFEDLGLDPIESQSSKDETKLREELKRKSKQIVEAIMTPMERREAGQALADQYINSVLPYPDTRRKDRTDVMKDAGFGSNATRRGKLGTIITGFGISGGTTAVPKQRKKASDHKRRYLSGAGAVRTGVKAADHGWQQFGKYILARKDLDDGSNLHIRYNNGQKIQAIPPVAVGGGMKAVLSTIADGKAPTYSQLSKISDSEKSYIQNVLSKASLDPAIFTKRTKTEKESNKNRFEILKGQIVAGNDNPEIIKEFKHILISMRKSKELPADLVTEILMELNTLGH